MKSTVEKLSPTRVRINVEVPFTELKPDFDRAYKQLAKQVRLPGFRPGKAPAKLLEARVGRSAPAGSGRQRRAAGSLQRGGDHHGVTTARPARYRGHQDLEDGEELVFTAEVDVRPDIDLPELSSLKISVDAVEIADDEVEAELEALRARFGTLKGVERPARTGDFVSIDLSAVGRR